MDYKDFEVGDFLQNEFFVDWVLRPNPESDHFWVNWINGRPEKRQEVELARELIKSLHYKEQYALNTKDYSHLMEKVLQHQGQTSVRHLLHRSFQNSFRITAFIFLLMSAAFTLYWWVSVSEVPPPEPVTWKMTGTEYGQKKTLVLSDGTKVILNSGSSIEFPESFGQATRHVKFKGEAFFEVARNAQKPFIIESGGLTTRVLGTSFNVQCFDEEDDISVSVVTGKVEIETETGQTALLQPNDMGVFNKVDKELTKRTFDIEKLIAWTSGTLLFENERLPEIFRKLEKWYGVRFVIQKGVNLQGKYSGEYKTKSLELVLEGLSYTSNFNYRINQKTITIYEKNLH